MIPQTVLPVKYFVGALYSSNAVLEKAIKFLEKELGPVDSQSDSFPFRATHYYDEEMGTPLFRRFFSFTRLSEPDSLAPAKIITNHAEDQFTIHGRRKVNLDIGYLDYDKVVLASAKYGIHKIYLRDGIFADLALHYEKGKFQPYPWAFLDFRGTEYYPFFLKIRTIYKSQVKRFAPPG
ncbi:MAG: DUF4416 family protein [Fidelibacterota bacterium]